MKIVDLFRYLKGYIRFSAKGGFSERFINLCAAKNIQLFNGTYVDGGFLGETDVRSFQKLRDIARKTGVRISVVSKCGLSFFIVNNKNRVGLLSGVAFYCVFLIIMNMFVWNIEAGGSELYSEEQLIEAAEKVGVKYGICRFIFDERKAAREIYKAFDDELSWVTVNIIASKCFIEVRDSDVSKNMEKVKYNEPSNLIADFDGIILSDETYVGIKNISKGSAVKKGDLLISGAMDNEYGSAVYYSAKGNFTARHSRYFMSVSDDENYFKLSSANEQTIFHLFGADVKLGNVGKTANEYIRSEHLSFDDHKLPFGFSKIVYADEICVSADQAKQCLLTADLYTQKTYSELCNTKILSDKIDFLLKEKNCSIKGGYDCIDFIGISKPIIVENIESK